MDTTPAVNLGLSLTSPATDFFVGGSTEVLFLGLQVVGGMRVGQVTRRPVCPRNGGTAPPGRICSRYFHVNFIRTLLIAAKGGG
jgi:hypothetical protein